MRIAFLTPSLANKGPVLVVKDLVTQLVLDPANQVEVFYFDDIPDLDFPVKTRRISFKDRFLFEGFDVVHSHGLRPDYYIFKNRKHIKAACVSTIHSIVTEEYRARFNALAGWLVQKLWVRVLQRHDALVCLSQYMLQHYKPVFPKTALHVVMNGRDLAEIPLPEEYDRVRLEEFRKRYRVIGTACVVTRRKGLHQVIAALPLLPEWGFVVVGEGPELQNLQQQAAAAGLSERCLFLGYRHQGFKFYPFFDIFVLSSYTEGLPLALLEAAALRTPTVCADIPLLREIFNDDEVSFFSLDNNMDFKTSVSRLMDNRSAYVSQMHKRYLLHYTSAAMAAHYRSIYQDLDRRKSEHE